MNTCDSYFVLFSDVWRGISYQSRRAYTRTLFLDSITFAVCLTLKLFILGVAFWCVYAKKKLYVFLKVRKSILDLAVFVASTVLHDHLLELLFQKSDATCGCTAGSSKGWKFSPWTFWGNNFYIFLATVNSENQAEKWKSILVQIWLFSSCYFFGGLIG